MREDGVGWLPSPFHWIGRVGQVPKWLILHGTAGGLSAQNIALWFTNLTAQASTNYVIGQDGAIVCCVNEEDAPYANGALTPGHDAFWDTLGGVNPNLVTISIEHVKPSIDNSDELTPAQQAASFALVQHICERWDIPMQPADASGGITGHASLDPVNRAQCPGPYPWDALWAYLQGSITPVEEIMFAPIDLSNPTVANYFTDASGQWKCRVGGFLLHDGMLAFYRMFGGNAFAGLTHLGLPLSNEVPRYTHYPDVTEQVFERGILRYDPKHVIDNPPGSADVYVAHADTPRLKVK